MSVSSDQRRVVWSAEADRRYFGGAAVPPTESNAVAKTGPECPTSFLVELPPFSRSFFNAYAERNWACEVPINAECMEVFLTVCDVVYTEITP